MAHPGPYPDRVSGYHLEGWDNFFVAAAGATAALSGLIFVALSLNMERILQLDSAAGAGVLTGRGLEALVALLDVLVVSVVSLTPIIAPDVLAVVLILAGGQSAIFPVRTARLMRKNRDYWRSTVVQIAVGIAFSASFALAGVTLLSGAGGGLAWLPLTFALAVLVAGMNAWVLLVEILR